MDADYRAARNLPEESLTIRRDIGDWQGIANSLEFRAAALVVAPPAAKAVRLLAAAASLRETIGSPLNARDRVQNNRTIVTMREKLTVEPFELAWREGHAMPWEQAVDHALGEADLS